MGRGIRKMLNGRRGESELKISGVREHFAITHIIDQSHQLKKIDDIPLNGTAAMKTEYLKSSLTSSFEAGLPQAIERANELQFINLIPNHWFSRAVSESLKLYVNGHFYGVIVTSQAYIEALGKFLCKLNGQSASKNDTIKDWKKMNERGFAKDSSLASAEKIYAGRNDFHHLNPTVENDYQKLKSLALDCLNNIFIIESEFFSYTYDNGKIVVANPKYWPKISTSEDQIQVYIRNI